MYNDFKCLILGGTWNEEGGRPSAYMTQVYDSVSKYINKDQITFYNGGSINDLFSLFRKVASGESPSDYKFIISYTNYDTQKYGHLNLRKYFNHSIITIMRKNHDHTIDKFKRYISYSKSDFLIEVLPSDEGYKTRIFNSNGIIISNYYYEIDRTFSRLLDEGYKKYTIPKVSLRYDPTYETTKEDLSIIQNTFDYLKGNTEFNIANLSVRDPKRYLNLNGKRVNIDSRIITTGATWNQNKRINRKNLSLIYHDERYFNVIRYGNCKPSTDSLAHSTLYSLFDNINYIIKSNDYFERSVYLPRIPIMRSVELSNFLANGIISNPNSSIFSIIGQGSYILLDSLDNIPDIKQVSNEITSLIPSYKTPNIKDKNLIEIGGEYLIPDSLIEKQFDDHYSLLNVEVLSDTDKVRIL